jgi:hypothetical protein
LAVVSLAAGIGGGLARLGVSPAPTIAISHHAVLMVAGFLGTVISLERAIAWGRAAGYAAPASSAAAGTMLLAGWTAAASAFWIVAACFLLLTSVALVRRQPMIHTVLLAIAAALWLAGQSAFAAGASSGVPEAWFGFLVLTIAAERLELTRLLPPRRLAAATFRPVVALLIAAVGASFVDPLSGALAFGSALIGLAVWLGCFDVARRTVHASGLARFTALALLAGYAWLAVGGAAWIALALGASAARDLALHAIALGFVFSMVLGHAPIVVPAIARAQLRFNAGLYLPLVLLHGSLLLRVTLGARSPEWRGAAGALNALAIAAFAGMLLRALERRTAAGIMMDPPDIASSRS